jgi:hypothetical protein
VIDHTARTVALLRFAENELKRQAEAGASDDYRRRVAKNTARCARNHGRDQRFGKRPKARNVHFIARSLRYHSRPGQGTFAVAAPKSKIQFNGVGRRLTYISFTTLENSPGVGPKS